ncbi:MAG: hypothetical protein NWE88_01835 [Candidatus Bathyarchaeota archaeon]|nr:hypothetical protein [Candidatus Bathyarchaeota archaeon]
MVRVKVIHSSNTSESHAVSRFEEEVNSFIQQDIAKTNMTLQKLLVSSTTHKNKFCLTATIIFKEKEIGHSKSKNEKILDALSQSIRRKKKFLVNVNVAAGEGIEDVFYGDLIDIGCIRHSSKAKSDFQEFEFKAITSDDRKGTRIKNGFKQNAKVVAVVAVSNPNLESLETLEKTYVVTRGNPVEFPTKVDTEHRNVWIAVIIEKNSATQACNRRAHISI